MRLKALAFVATAMAVVLAGCGGAIDDGNSSLSTPQSPKDPASASQQGGDDDTTSSPGANGGGGAARPPDEIDKSLATCASLGLSMAPSARFTATDPNTSLAGDMYVEELEYEYTSELGELIRARELLLTFTSTPNECQVRKSGYSPRWVDESRFILQRTSKTGAPAQITPGFYSVALPSHPDDEIGIFTRSEGGQACYTPAETSGVGTAEAVSTFVGSVTISERTPSSVKGIIEVRDINNTNVVLNTIVFDAPFCQAQAPKSPSEVSRATCCRL